MDKTLDLDELERVAREATPGEWVSFDRDTASNIYSAGNNGSLLAVCHSYTTDVSEKRPNAARRKANATYIATFDPPTILTLIAAARPAVVSDEVVDCYCGGFGPRGSVEHREGCPELDEDRRQRAALALLPGGVPDREAIAAIVRHAMQEFASSEVQQSPFGERVDALKNGGDIAADAIITMLSGPAVPDGWSDLEMAEAFYRAMYEDQGGKWYAVDPSAHPFWIKASQKFVRAMLSASPKEVSPDPTHGRRE